jgi:hypothetical protein
VKHHLMYFDLERQGSAMMGMWTLVMAIVLPMMLAKRLMMILISMKLRDLALMVHS